MSSSLVVYKASAGSGKTFTLAVQYIKLLITTTPQEYRHTLAVTFTNKATAEMKERILEQLYGISRSLRSSESYLDALMADCEDRHGMSEEEYRQDIRRRCGMALHEILHDYSRFRVETIDSFFQSVLRNLAHELGLSARMQVDLNDKEVLNQAVDNIVDDLGRKDGDILPWINNYIKERIESGEKWDVRDDIKQFAKCIFREDYMRRDEGLRQKLTSGENLKAFRSEMHLLEKEITGQLEAATERITEEIRASGIDFDTHVSYGKSFTGFLSKVQHFRETLSKPATGDYFWGDRLEKLTGDPTAFLKKEYRKDAALLTAAEMVCGRLRELNDQAHKAMRQQLTIRLAMKHLNPLRLLNHIDQEVTEITSEANRFILAKTPILLSRLIQGSDAPFVFEKMGTLFHNVMIDEFQDTSRLQWQNFKVLMLENQSQGGRDLLVGDIKQSIYRWRNGDWRILARIGEEMSAHKPEIRNLDTNFRSEYHIIHFNNEFFPRAADYLNAYAGEAGIVSEIYGDVRQECSKKDRKGWVRTAVYQQDAKEWEEEMLSDLCRHVSQLHDQGIPYEEMCILQRDRNHVDTLIAYFHDHLPGVELVSDEAFNLESSRSLNVIINALKYLACDREKDAVSIRLLMQSYIKDILKQDAGKADFALADPSDVLPREFLSRTGELSDYPLYELCEEIYSILGISRIEGEDSYLLSFYDELSAYLQNAPGDITSFLEFWEGEMRLKSIPACKVNGICILTIHKSKGLQYHTVLMPYCNFSFERFKAGDLLWCEPTAEPFSRMDVLPIQPGKQMQNSLFAPYMQEEALQKNIEELNALYVAFTRAEKNLLVWTRDEKGMTAGNVIAGSLPLIGGLETEEADDVTVYSLGSPVFEQKRKASTQDNRLLPAMEPASIRMCSHRRRHDFKQSTEGMLFMEELDETVEHDLLKTADGLTYAQQGSLLHEIFSKIEHADQVDEVVREYADKGVLTNGEQTKRITGLIRRALGQRQAKNWFNGSYTVQNECEIASVNAVTHKAEVLRPDRVMMNDEEIIVVDFKFGKPHPEEYHNQVSGYMKLLGEMYPTHKVSGYLWYVYRNVIEETGK